MEWIRRSPAARSTKQKARIDRFDQAVAAKPGTEDQRVGALSLRLPSGPRLGKTVLELRAATYKVGERPLFEALDLTMKPGDRIGIVGPNGVGKTTLMRAIAGQLELDSGSIKHGQNTVCAFLDQARESLDPDRTVLEEVSGNSEHVHVEGQAIHVRTFLRMMLFADSTADTRIGDLSGGERNRVELARLLRTGGNLIMLDEPTNDLDLVTLGVLEDALVAFPGCALIVSHDRWFLDKVATGILAFEGDGRVTFYEGSHSSYLDKAASKREREDKKQSKSPERPPRQASPRPRKLTFKERHELDGLEEAIGAAEGRVAELEATLSDPEIYKTRSAEVPAMVASLEKARIEVERLYARWQELEAIAAASS